jgi:Tol biopolymer transport system component
VNLSRKRARDGDPSWSPDETRIASASDRQCASIWVMDAEASNQERLGGSVGSPDWGPGGTCVEPIPTAPVPSPVRSEPSFTGKGKTP